MRCSGDLGYVRSEEEGGGGGIPDVCGEEEQTGQEVGTQDQLAVDRTGECDKNFSPSTINFIQYAM